MNRFTLTPLVTAVILSLAACGGGDGPATPPDTGSGTPPGQTPVVTPAPTITRFETVGEPLFIGDTVRVRADYAGGQGRIAPDAVDVPSGREVALAPLDRSRTLRLTVSRAGQPDAVRELPLRAEFRNRYLAVDLSLAVSQHAAVSADDGSVVIIGGTRGESTMSSQIDRYDPRTNSIARIGQLSQGRANAVATALPGGLALVTGGAFSGTDWRLAELVDTRSGAVTPAGQMSVLRTGHAAIALPGGRVLVTGGVTAGEGFSLGLSPSAEIWDPATRSFRRLSSTMLEPRANHTMTLLPDGRVLIVGGYSNAEAPLFAEVFDPATEQFSSLRVWFSPRAEHAAFVQADGQVLIVGGEQPQPGQEEWVPTDSVLRFDPARNRFTVLAPLAAPRSWVRGALTPDGELLLFGGRQVDTHHSWTGERYSPERGGVAIANLDGERAQHTVTRLPSGRIAVIGGESRMGNFAGRVRIYE